MFCSQHNFEIFECITSKYGNFKKGKLYTARAYSHICGTRPGDSIRYSMFQVRDEYGDKYSIDKNDINKLFKVVNRKDLKKWDKLCNACDECQYGYWTKDGKKCKSGLHKYNLTVSEFRYIQNLMQDILNYHTPINFEVFTFNDAVANFFARFGYKVEKYDEINYIISEG